jgi:KTSC domain-containing protein
MMPLAVESTTLITIAYDLDRQLLHLEFRDRAIYHYFDVPVDVYQGLVIAPSKGGYFNRSIRGRFVHARLETTASLS